MKRPKRLQLFMDPDTSRNIALILGVLTLAVMVYSITQRAMDNRTEMLESNAPKVAGEDELAGGARNPQQFDEPDEEALNEMADLLGDDEESTMES